MKRRKQRFGIELLAEKLRETGYDGLYNSLNWCWCKVDNLMPCGGLHATCEIAKYYLLPRVCPKCKEYRLGCDDLYNTVRYDSNSVYILLPALKPKLQCLYCDHWIKIEPIDATPNRTKGR